MVYVVQVNGRLHWPKGVEPSTDGVPPKVRNGWSDEPVTDAQIADLK